MQQSSKCLLCRSVCNACLCVSVWGGGGREGGHPYCFCCKKQVLAQSKGMKRLILMLIRQYKTCANFRGKPRFGTHPQIHTMYAHIQTLNAHPHTQCMHTLKYTQCMHTHKHCMHTHTHIQCIHTNVMSTCKYNICPPSNTHNVCTPTKTHTQCMYTHNHIQIYTHIQIHTHTHTHTHCNHKSNHIKQNKLYKKTPTLKH